MLPNTMLMSAAVSLRSATVIAVTDFVTTPVEAMSQTANAKTSATATIDRVSFFQIERDSIFLL